MILDFYKGKRVFITGHTGFKGSWLCEMLWKLGAHVYGYGLEPCTEPALFHLLGLSDRMNSAIGDIRKLSNLKRSLDEAQPEIVFHLAAQPIVRKSYADPVGTYSTNVMGTVHLLESVRTVPSVRSVVNVTTDKVYQNQEWEWPYREDEPLNGYDPYSNSKSCSELVTDCYRKSFFSDCAVAISTVRAGNVIGGGDFAENRIIPDCVRAAAAHKEIFVRNPHSVRPYQHVLDALYAYIVVAAGQYQNPDLSGAYNVGPSDAGCWRTDRLVQSFVDCWGENARWAACPDGGPHEASVLRLDSSRIKRAFQWRAVWNTDIAMNETVKWYRCWHENGDVRVCMDEQIEGFFKEVDGDDEKRGYIVARASVCGGKPTKEVV